MRPLNITCGLLQCFGQSRVTIDPPQVPSRFIQSFGNCNDTQKIAIKDAFSDAIKLGQVVQKKYESMNSSDLDNDLPLIEYLGPHAFDREKFLGILRGQYFAL